MDLAKTSITIFNSTTVMMEQDCGWYTGESRNIADASVCGKWNCAKQVNWKQKIKNKMNQSSPLLIITYETFCGIF